MKSKRLDLAMPATYRITVLGNLDESWSDRLGGMSITPTSDSSGSPVTILSGQLRDQAALLGVLNALYDPLHLPLLSVEYLADE
jgi:hypothetical protein